MTRTIALRAAVAAGATLAVLVPTGAADAGSGVVRDVAGDVTTIALADSGEPTTAPTQRRGDLTSVRTSYTRGAITVTARVRQLPRRFIAGVELATAAGGGRFGVLAARSGRTLEAVLLRGLDEENEVPCDGLAIRRRANKQTLTIRIPAACVGTPRWVRTGVALSGMRVPAPAELLWPGAFEDLRIFVDVAGMTGTTERLLDSQSSHLPLGPKVRRS